MKLVLSNQLHIQNPDPELSRMVCSRLRFQNPKWEENERMGRWNQNTPRYLEFYQKRANGDLILPRGYIRQLILLIRKHRLAYTLVDNRRILPEQSFAFAGTLRPFQQAAVEKMVQKEFGTLSAPTGSGKTVMALWLLAHRKQPALIVVHTKALANQWIQQIQNFLDISESQIGQIGDGKRQMERPITVALVQSLYKCAHAVRLHTGYLIVDECHRTPSRTFTEAVLAFDCRYMLGLSATPWRRDRLSRLIFWHLGDLHHQIEPTQLRREGHILQAEVLFRKTDFVPFHHPVSEYSKMLSELTANDARNRLIAGDIAEAAGAEAGVCLVLSDRKKHCKLLQNLLRYKHGVPAELLTGDLGAAQRNAVLEKLKKGEVKVLIATGQLIGEGFDCPALSVLFIATPVRFSGRLLQYLGRVLRPADGKKTAKVYDYVDLHVGPLLAAARARQGVYGKSANTQQLQRNPGDA